MTTHRFILEPYKGIATRHTCPACHRKRCFSRYVDTEKQISFPDHVGRCDHEQKCGYISRRGIILMKNLKRNKYCLKKVLRQFCRNRVR